MGWHDKNRKRNKGHVTSLFEDKVPYGKNWYDKLFMESEKVDDEEELDEMKDVEDEEEIEKGCDKKKKDNEEMEEEEGKKKADEEDEEEDEDDEEDEEMEEESGETKLKRVMDMYKKASPQDKKKFEKMMDMLMNPDKHYDEEGSEEDEEDVEQIDELMDTSFGGRVRNQKDPEYRQRRIHSKVHSAAKRKGIGTPAADRLERMNLGDNEEDIEDDE